MYQLNPWYNWRNRIARGSAAGCKKSGRRGVYLGMDSDLTNAAEIDLMRTPESTAAQDALYERVNAEFGAPLVRLARARRVLEVGTFTGYSALCMAEGLPEGGELITCDIDPEAVNPYLT